MNILVTGGAGYIGSHTCKLLAQRGYSPITYDNLSTGHRDAVKWGPFEEGDISNRIRLDEVIKQYQPNAVIHFAAYSLVGESVGSPAKYYRNNVSGTLTLLEAMRDHGIKHIVFSSSCAVYGMPNEIPIPEGHALDPISPYGRSKMMIEYLLEDFSQAYDMKNISLRYFNAAGADVDGEIGENHNPESHLIPLVLDTALGKRSAILIKKIHFFNFYTKLAQYKNQFIHISNVRDITYCNF